MNAYHLLQILKDARDLGRDDEAAAVIDEIGCDAKHVRFEVRNRALKPFFDRGDDFDQDHDRSYEPTPIADQVREAVTRERRRDYTEWKTRTASNVTAFAAIMKQYYNENTVATLALRAPPRPFRALSRFREELRAKYGGQEPSS